MSHLVARRLNCCAWRCSRTLTTSSKTPAAAVAPPTPRTARRAHALYPLATYDRRHLLDGRRFYSSKPLNSDIAVLGGGLTGLTTAYYLAKKLPPSVNITLYEASNRLGGWVRTERHPVDIGGKKGTVLFERGPRSLTSLDGNYWRYDDVVLYDLARTPSQLPHPILKTPPVLPRYIYYPDHLVPLPPHIPFFDLIREPLFTQNIPAAIVMFFKKLFKSSDPANVPNKDLSISDWLYELSNSRHAAGTMASAVIHGIYGGDIDKLSARSVFDRFFWGWYLPDPPQGMRLMPQAEMEVLDTLGKDKQIQSMALKPKGALMDFGAAGMQSLPDALVAALQEQSNVTIKLNSPITSIKLDTDKDKLEITSGDKDGRPDVYHKVISTMTAQDLARAADGKLPTLAKSEAVDIMTVNLWFPDEDIKPPGTGYLIPRTVAPEVNPDHVLGVFFDSDVQTRGPDEPAGTKLFVLMGGHYYQQPGVSPPSETEAIAQARSVLERHLGISRDRPCHAVARLAKQCIPQHYVGHQESMVEAQRELRGAYGGRLAVAGGSYTRIGAVAALRAGYDIAHHMTKENWLDVTGIDEIASGAFSFTMKAEDEVLVRRR
ncbi:hypothetical protein BGZ63DRAFT_352482 [Mariannaea sp. PMI_226]|nr:hypothetical protein BGZ63DRAFT_352482 [Mariannaea sp. PMI_226]